MLDSTGSDFSTVAAAVRADIKFSSRQFVSFSTPKHIPGSGKVHYGTKNSGIRVNKALEASEFMPFGVQQVFEKAHSISAHDLAF
jgi:beta-glucosidase-like glycosyl hydrolase